MPKLNSLENATSTGTNSETHSKKWFTKISLKIPKKLKNGKSTSTLSNAINNAKKNSTIDSTTQWENTMSNQTIYDPSGENTYLSNGTQFTQTSQLTLNNNTKNENTINTDTSSIINIPVESKQQNEIIEEDTFQSIKLNLRNRQRRMTSSRLKPLDHRRSSSDHVSSQNHRPRSYSDVQTPLQSTSLYSFNDDDDDEYISESREFGESRKNIPHLKIVKENYYFENDLDLCDVKTPIVTKNTPIDTSNVTSSSNTIMEKLSSTKNTNATSTPVLRPNRNVNSHDKFSKFIEAMQNKSCDSMTAKEFAMAVGITIRSDDDCSDDEYDDDTNSICTLSSTLSQLTANGKVPTANEIYNALSIKSSYRQRRKQSAPILNLEMFNPPTPGECRRPSCSSQSLKNFSRSNEYSNQKLEKKGIPTYKSTVKSNESNLTCVASTSSIHSSHSGNTTSYISDLPDSDYDSVCSNCSIVQHSINNTPDFSGNNNITTTFYSLPRNDLQANVKKSKPITASKSTNSIPVNNYYSFNTHRGEVGIISSNSRHHSRVATSISNSQSQSKSINSSPNLNTTNLLNISTTGANISDNHYMYKNSKSIPNNNSSVTSNNPSPTLGYKYPTSYSWSNGLNDTPKPRLSSTPTTITFTRTKRTIDRTKPKKVEVYTKGRFTITREVYNHNPSTSSHIFQVERI